VSDYQLLPLGRARGPSSSSPRACAPARTMRTRTFFGAIAFAAGGLQRGQRLAVVRCRAGIGKVLAT
jgi:hypothetical protein